MTSLSHRMGRAAVACALALALLAPAARAARREKPPAAPPVAEVVAPSGPRPLPLTSESMDPRRLALARAAAAHAAGDFAGVARALEPLALETHPAFPDADRAAFLLGHAWWKLGERERFVSLAKRAATWTPQTPFSRWLGFELLLAGDAPAADSAARTGGVVADALAASELLRDENPGAVLALLPAGATRDPLLLLLRAAALAKLGRDDQAELERLAQAELRSVNAQIEFLLRDALARRGRTPRPRAPPPGIAGGEDS